MEKEEFEEIFEKIKLRIGNLELVFNGEKPHSSVFTIDHYNGKQRWVVASWNKREAGMDFTCVGNRFQTEKGEHFLMLMKCGQALADIWFDVSDTFYNEDD
ncbi:MAG: hypothetical protein GPJ52_00740 [Candidatus Heimdallarchaeota archaeon]|nr:hypothetical protein [Candidatus Heimdallarchaeota archaeon]